MINHTIRLGRMVLGLMLLAVGALLSLPLVPGPGVVLVLVGLGLLSHEFEWARRLRDWAHTRGRQGWERLTRRRHVG